MKYRELKSRGDPLLKQMLTVNEMQGIKIVRGFIDKPNVGCK